MKNAAAASRPTARHPNFGPIKTVLEAISFGLGILGFIPGPQQPVLLALSSILGGVSAFLGCLETGINADCLINVAFALLPGPIFKLAKPFKATVAKVFRDTFAQFKNLFKKPPKPQIKPKQSKPSPATSCTTRNSFTGDTVVLMADGTSKSIKNVQLGDKVIATDPETGQQGARVVTALIRHGGDHDMVKITTGAGTVIHATDQHPFWDTIDQEWVNAEDLTTTDVLVTAGGTEVHVASVSTYVEDVVAYNLTVDDLHTYHVSDADILVHNCPSEGTPRTNTAQNKQYRDAVNRVQALIGRRLEKPELDDLHDAITKQNMGFHEIVEEAVHMFKGKNAPYVKNKRRPV